MRHIDTTLEQARASANRRAQLEKMAFVILEREKRYRVQPESWPQPWPEGWVVAETIQPPENTSV